MWVMAFMIMFPPLVSTLVGLAALLAVSLSEGVEESGPSSVKLAG